MIAKRMQLRSFSRLNLKFCKISNKNHSLAAQSDISTWIAQNLLWNKPWTATIRLKKKSKDHLQIHTSYSVTWSTNSPAPLKNNSWPAGLFLIKAETANNAFMASSLKLDFTIIISFGSPPSSRTYRTYDELLQYAQAHNTLKFELVHNM